MHPEKLDRRPWGRGRGKKKSGREANHKRLLKTENKLRVDGRVGGRGKWMMDIEEGTCWDEHWVLYRNQFDNKLYIYMCVCVCVCVYKYIYTYIYT